MAKVEVTKATIEGWKREGAYGVGMRKYIFAHEWETLCDLAIKGLASAAPEALAFQEAVWLLEVCRSCDLVYDGPWGPTGPDVHVIVDAFLKKHKSVIEGYAPQCPESPLAQKHERTGLTEDDLRDLAEGGTSTDPTLARPRIRE